MQILPFVALGAAGFSAGSQLQAGKQAGKVADYNAKVSEQEAEAERASSELVAYQKLKNLQAAVGTQTAGFSGSGIDVTTGSPLDVVTDTLNKGNLDIAIGKYNSEVTARGLESQAELTRFRGKQAKKASQVGAALTLLKGGSSFAKTQGIGLPKPEEGSGLPG